MITAYVLHAVIVFWPASNSQPVEDRILPIKLSFDTQEECTAALRARIAAHMERTGVPSVRKEQSYGRMCLPLQIAAPYTEEDDRQNLAQTLAVVRGSSASKDVLSEFTK
jgi:hypothetical protein